MRRSDKKTILVTFGNELLGDDAVGLVAGRILQRDLGNQIDVVESNGMGLDLLDILAGYDRAVMLDAIHTNCHPPGTILEFSKKDFNQVIASSPHYMGIPEVFQLADQLGIGIPSDCRILAMEIEDPYCVREGLHPSVQNSLPEFVKRAEQALKF